MARGAKKGMVALSVPLVDLGFPVDLGAGLMLEDTPGPLSDFWVKGLGEWKVEAFHERNVVVTCTAGSDSVEVLDGEHSLLTAQAWDFTGALVMCGLRLNSAPLSLSRSLSADEDSLRRYGEQAEWYETAGITPSVLNPVMLRNAQAVYHGLRSVSQSRGQFQRFLKGYRSLFTGMGLKSCDERAYHFARALEALHATKHRDGKQAFVRKCCALCGPSEELASMFDELFEIRNNVVHVNPFQDLASPSESLKEAEARVVATCASAELVAKEVYRLILSDPVLLGKFATDESIRALWNSGFSLDFAVCPDELRVKREQVLEEWELRTYQ